MRGYDSWRGHGVLQAGAMTSNGLMTTLAMAAVLTFGNPHVYLNTMVLIGAVSLQFVDSAKIAAGAATASLSFLPVSAMAPRYCQDYETSKCVAYIGCGGGCGDVGTRLWYGTGG